MCCHEGMLNGMPAFLNTAVCALSGVCCGRQVCTLLLFGSTECARTKDGDNEAVDDAEPAGPPVATADLGLLHNQVDDGRHPERGGALHTSMKTLNAAGCYQKRLKIRLDVHEALIHIGSPQLPQAES